MRNCLIHSQQQVISICISPACNLPLCALCLPQHLLFHRKRNTPIDNQPIFKVIDRVSVEARRMQENLARAEERVRELRQRSVRSGKLLKQIVYTGVKRLLQDFLQSCEAIVSEREIQQALMMLQDTSSSQNSSLQEVVRFLFQSKEVQEKLERQLSQVASAETKLQHLHQKLKQDIFKLLNDNIASHSPSLAQNSNPPKLHQPLPTLKPFESCSLLHPLPVVFRPPSPSFSAAQYTLPTNYSSSNISQRPTPQPIPTIRVMSPSPPRESFQKTNPRSLSQDQPQQRQVLFIQRPSVVNPKLVNSISLKNFIDHKRESAPAFQDFQERQTVIDQFPVRHRQGSLSPPVPVLRSFPRRTQLQRTKGEGSPRRKQKLQVVSALRDIFKKVKKRRENSLLLADSPRQKSARRLSLLVQASSLPPLPRLKHFISLTQHFKQIQEESQTHCKVKMNLKKVKLLTPKQITGQQRAISISNQLSEWQREQQDNCSEKSPTVPNNKVFILKIVDQNQKIIDFKTFELQAQLFGQTKVTKQSHTKVKSDPVSLDPKFIDKGLIGELLKRECGMWFSSIRQSCCISNMKQRVLIDQPKQYDFKKYRIKANFGNIRDQIQEIPEEYIYKSSEPHLIDHCQKLQPFQLAGVARYQSSLLQNSFCPIMIGFEDKLVLMPMVFKKFNKELKRVNIFDGRALLDKQQQFVKLTYFKEYQAVLMQMYQSQVSLELSFVCKSSPKVTIIHRKEDYKPYPADTRVFSMRTLTKFSKRARQLFDNPSQLLFKAINRADQDMAIQLANNDYIDVHWRDQFNNTFLLMAVNQGLDRLAMRLVKIGVAINDVNDEGDSALHLAVGSMKTQLSQFLLKHGADISIKNKQGITPGQLM